MHLLKCFYQGFYVTPLGDFLDPPMQRHINEQHLLTVDRVSFSNHSNYIDQSQYL